MPRAAGLRQTDESLRTGSAGHYWQRGISLTKLFDVIVVGGGPAGLKAARTAARNVSGAGIPALVFDNAALLQRLFDDCAQARQQIERLFYLPAKYGMI